MHRDVVTGGFPDFKWRQGNCDAAGPYVSGMNGDDVQIKLLLGESPAAISVCFTGAWGGANDRETRKSKLIELFDTTVIPQLGTSVKKDGSTLGNLSFDLKQGLKGIDLRFANPYLSKIDLL
jgi:hypothetical protein